MKYELNNPNGQREEVPLAVITGAAKRVGKLFANYFASKGYSVVLHYYRSEKEVLILKEELLKFNIPIHVVQADLRKNSGLEYFFSFIDALIDNDDLFLYKFKVLVNSAAEMKNVIFSDLSLSEFDKTINLNLRAPFACSQYAAKKMVNGGLIINISDIAGQKNWINYPDYVISKAGLDSMTRTLAKLLSPRIRVNGIAPGLVMKSPGLEEIAWNNLISKMPMKHSVNPDDLCRAMDFIINSESVTGQTIVVDSGYSLI